MLITIKAITDETNRETLIAPIPIPSHLPTMKLTINKIILSTIKTDGIPYCRGDFFF